VNSTEKLKKSEYSEMVVRKALYWMSDIAEWTLNSDDNYWLIDFNTANLSATKAKFSRLLNDQILREKMDLETDHVRRAIISKVLSDINGSL